MRIIDADVAVKKILDVRDNDLHIGYPRAFEQGVIRKALRCIEETPTLETEPVRHGRWIHNIADYPQSGWIEHKCSICEHWQVTNQPTCEHLIYCPNCGAKMDLEE